MSDLLVLMTQLGLLALTGVTVWFMFGVLAGMAASAAGRPFWPAVNRYFTQPLGRTAAWVGQGLWFLVRQALRVILWAFARLCELLMRALDALVGRI